jgi:hypothetical protein
MDAACPLGLMPYPSISAAIALQVVDLETPGSFFFSLFFSYLREVSTTYPSASRGADKQNCWPDLQ